MSVFSCILTEYGNLLGKSALSSNAGKYGPEKPQIRTHFTQWNLQIFPPKDTVLMLLMPEPTVCIVLHGFWIIDEMFLFLYDVIKK